MRLAKPRSPVRRPSQVGLSLIEVTIAFGIFAFAIVAILGLLTTSLHSDQGAANDTTLARIAETTMTRLRSQGFTVVHTNTAYDATDTGTDFYYDFAGSPQDQPTADSHYGCVVTRTATASTNLDYLKLEFRWPVFAPTHRQESRMLNASFANEY